MNTEWIPLIPTTHGGSMNKKEVTLRDGGLYLNVLAVKALNLLESDYVRLAIEKDYTNNPANAPRVKIFKEEDSQNHGICKISRQKGSSGFFVPCAWIYKMIPRLKELKRGSLQMKRLALKTDNGNDHYINLIPAFENKTTLDNLPEFNGIYRLKDFNSNPEVVYIGHGNIKSRVQEHIDDKTFQTVEYSIVDQEDDRKYYERFYLDNFLSTHNRLPKYNKQKSNFKKNKINDIKSEVYNGNISH
jgi:hypothetical protein